MNGSSRRVHLADPAPHLNVLMPARSRPAGNSQTTSVLWAGSQRGNGSNALDPATPQYPVLLLNEEQVAQLLQRQSMRTVNPRIETGVAFAAYTRFMRRARFVMAALLLISAGAGAWVWAPLPLHAAFPWAGADAPPPVATGASFSLTVASPRSAAAARDLSRRLAAAGTPAFVRTAVASHHVMAGPYVSLDEAEIEQRRLSHAGFGGTRVFVDDSLRKTAAQKLSAVAPGRPALVLVAAAQQLSLVFEFEREPKQVTTKRGADGTVLVEMGPIDDGVEPQEWSAPAGVTLFRQVTVEEIVGSPETRLARATLAMPRSTMAHARVEGRRVYVDLAPAPRVVPRAAPAVATERTAPRRAAAPRPAAPPAPAAAVVPPPAGAAADAPRPPAAESLRPVLARFQRVVPFLQSATRTASPDVLRAVASSVDELEAALGQAMPAPETADAHAALTSALASARRAVDAAYAGDRVAEAHQAAMFVEAARTVLPPIR